MEREYEPKTIKVHHWLPPATAVGNGWWKLTWDVEYEERPMRNLSPSVPLPIPVPGEDRTLGCAIVLPAGEGKLRLELLTRFEKLTGDDVNLIRWVLRHVQEMVGILRIDGMADHFLLPGWWEKAEEQPARQTR